MKKREDLIASIVLIVFSGAYLFGAFLIPMPPLKQQMGPDAFPKAVGVLMLMLAVIYLLQQFRHTAAEKEKAREAEREKRAAMIGAEEKVEKKADLKTMGFMLVVMLCYAFVFERLGYAISTFAAFMIGAIYLDRKHLVRDAIIAVIASFVLYYIFSEILRVMLPSGPLTEIAMKHKLSSLADLLRKFGL